MSRDMLQELSNGQNAVWTLAVVAGVLAGLLDLSMSIWSARKRRGEPDRETPDEVMQHEAGRAGPGVAPPVAADAPLPAARASVAEAAEAAGPAQARAAAPEPAPSPVAGVAPPTAVPSFPRRQPAEPVDPSLTAEELLERAEQHLAAGARDQAATHYRAAIRMAQRAKLPAVEAQARIELGDLSKENGDLTSACEHWQMARVLFAALDKPQDVHTTVERMEKAGCPTDWVLNQF